MLKMFQALRPGRGTTKFVAASDAAPLSKLLADYVCDGTNDEVEIAAAFAALPASRGVVRLSEGTFSIGATLTLSVSNAKLIGSGLGTILFAATNMAVTQTSIVNITGNNFHCSDLLVDGNFANQSSGACFGVVCAGTDISLHRVTVQNAMGASGISVTGDRTTIIDCVGKSCSSSLGNGIFVSSGVGSRIVGCVAINNAGHGIQINSGPCIVQGSYAASNAFDGFTIAGTANNVIITNNFCSLNGRNGIRTGVSVTNSGFIANATVGNSQATTLTSANMEINGTGNFVIDNLCRQGSQTNKPTYGLLNAGTNSYVRNNDLYDGGATGEYLDSSATHTRKQARSQIAVAGGDTINTTTAETNFATGHALAADALKHIGRVIRIYAAGTYGTLGSGTVTLQLKLKIGTTTVLDFGTITTAVSIATRRWRVEAVLTVVAVGASGSVECAGAARVPTANDDVTASRPDIGSTTTIDTTTVQTVQISAQHGASSVSNTVVLREFVVELLN